MRSRPRRTVFFILAVFFLTFVGGGSFQLYLRNALPEQWSRLRWTSLLAAVYFSFMFWRLLIPASQRFFGDTWSLVLAALSYILVPVALLFTTNFVLLVSLALVWGWGAAGLWQTGPVWLYDVTSQRRRGLWAGAIYASVFLAQMTGAAVQGEAAAISHRTALLSLAIAPGLLAVAAALLLPPRKSPAQPLRAAAVRLAVSDRRLVLLGVLLFASATAYGLLLGAFRDGIQESLGTDALKGILAAYFGTRLAVAVLGGFSSDVLGRKFVVALAFIGGGVTLAIAALTGGVWGFRASAVTLGLVSGVVPVSVTAYAGDWFAAGKRSLALGAAFVWRDAGMVLSLLGGQVLVEIAGSFTVALVVFAVLFIACGLGALALPSRSTEERAE